MGEKMEAGVGEKKIDKTVTHNEKRKNERTNERNERGLTVDNLRKNTHARETF